MSDISHISVDTGASVSVYDVADAKMRAAIGTTKVTTISDTTAVPTAGAVKHYVDDRTSAAVRWAGSVSTAADLPKSPSVGDMYNIASDSSYGPAGTNVIWTSSGAWDAAAGLTAEATTSAGGLMSASDKAKLDGVAPKATRVTGTVQPTVATAVSLQSTVVKSATVQPTVVTSVSLASAVVATATYSSADETLTLTMGQQSAGTGAQSVSTGTQSRVLSSQSLKVERPWRR